MKIKVYRTVKQVLHKITSRREYALITTKKSINAPNRSYLISLKSSDGSPVDQYIFVGGPVFSRERFDKSGCLKNIRALIPDIIDDEVSFPDIKELYNLSDGKILELDVEGKEREEVNHRLIYDCLQFKDREKKHYLSNDFTTVRISLSRIAGRTLRNKEEKPVPEDAACFEVYDRMIDVLSNADKHHHYGDACCIEYSIISDGYEFRYFITHFFSNHNWNADPENLLNICFTAELIHGACGKKNVRFSHPSKITSRKSNGAEYFVEKIKMDNSEVSVKFRDSKTNEPSEGDVAGYRTYDNPVDFAMWVDLYHQEIRMA